MADRGDFKVFSNYKGLMLSCAFCREPVGGRCPKCERVICWKCTVAVKMPSNEVAWRCRECAAELILAQGGVAAQTYESIEDGMIVDKIVDGGPK